MIDPATLVSSGDPRVLSLSGRTFAIDAMRSQAISNTLMPGANSRVYTRPASGMMGKGRTSKTHVTFCTPERLQDEISQRRCTMQLSSGPAGLEETPLGKLYQRHWLGLFATIRQQINS